MLRQLKLGAGNGGSNFQKDELRDDYGRGRCFRSFLRLGRGASHRWQLVCSLGHAWFASPPPPPAAFNGLRVRKGADWILGIAIVSMVGVAVLFAIP
jgi:hypothetical protein